MSHAHYQPLDHDIVCIDALYTGPGQACCYLVGSAGEYALVETGTARSLPNVVATLNELGVSRAQLRFIIPTHVHLDHAGACGQLMALLPDAELLVHPRGARHLIDPERLVASSLAVYGEDVFRKLYDEILPVPAGRVRPLEDGEVIELGDRRLRVLHTRGHADHHLCLFDERSHSWFSGDMFGISYPAMRFDGGAFVMPATTPTQFDPYLYAASVRALAEARPRHCYLTHFSTLPFADEQVAMLCRQLDAYAALGRNTEATQGTLAEAVLAIAADEMARVAGDARARDVVSSLRMDAELNAQGIAWWRDRHLREQAS